MASYIDVDNLNVSDYIEAWECNCSENGRQVVMAVDDLQYLPTADVQEVKHGRWEYSYATCSNCSHTVATSLSHAKKFYNYCPNCGAKMDKECETK